MSKTLSVSRAGLTRVDGSARLAAGNTSLIVSVTGPIEPKLRQELPTQASLEIIVRPSRGVSTPREKAFEDLLRSVLQSVIVRYRYPRQLIQIVVQFLATDVDLSGGIIISGNSADSGADFTANELSAALNGCFFALIDANIALYNSFASATLAVDGKSGEIVTDPSLKCLQKSASHHLVCFDIREQKASKILLVESNGSFTDAKLISVIETASQYCEKLHVSVQRPFIERTIEEDFIWAS